MVVVVKIAMSPVFEGIVWGRSLQYLVIAEEKSFQWPKWPKIGTSYCDLLKMSTQSSHYGQATDEQPCSSQGNRSPLLYLAGRNNPPQKPRFEHRRLATREECGSTTSALYVNRKSVVKVV